MQMAKLMGNEHGISLIEICIGITLFIVIFAGIANVFSSSLSVFTQSMTRGIVEQSAVNTIAIVRNEIEVVESISFPVAGAEADSIYYKKYDDTMKMIIDCSMMRKNVDGKDYLEIVNNNEIKSQIYIEGLKKLNFNRQNGDKKIVIEVVAEHEARKEKVSKEFQEEITLLN